MLQAFQALSRIQMASNATHQPDALLGRYRLPVNTSMSIMLYALSPKRKYNQKWNGKPLLRLCLSIKSGSNMLNLKYRNPKSINTSSAYIYNESINHMTLLGGL